MSEESTVIYFYDEELRQISREQLEQLIIQSDSLNVQYELFLEQQKQINEIRQIYIALLVVLGACLGALIFRHLRK